MNDQEKEIIKDQTDAENLPISETEIEEIEESEHETIKLIHKQKPFIIAASVLGVILLGVIGLLIWRSSNSEEGHVVPAPRTVNFGTNEPGETDANVLTEKTLTIPPEQIENIKIETAIVGETLSGEAVSATSTGVVRANDYAETPAISLVGGVVRNVSAQLGEFVRQGKTIATVYSDELATTQSDYLSMNAELDEAEKRYKRALELTDVSQEARTELDRAEAELKIAEAEHMAHFSHYQRSAKLVKIGAESRQSFEMVRAEHETAQAKFDEAKKRFERAKQLLKINPERKNEIDRTQAQVRSIQAKAEAERQKLLVLGLSPNRINQIKTSRKISSDLAITSPVSGTITERSVNNGEIIEANKELFKITNLGTIWVIAEVYEKDLAQIRTGTGATVSSNAFPGQVFRGQVTYIDPNLNESTRTAQVRIVLENPNGMLKIGQYVNVAFGALGTAERTAPVVPSDAVQAINNKSVVFLVTDQPNVFTVRQVSLGAEKDKSFTVLGGINVGDKVVTNGSFLLRAEWVKQNAEF